VDGRENIREQMLVLDNFEREGGYKVDRGEKRVNNGFV